MAINDNKSNNKTTPQPSKINENTRQDRSSPTTANDSARKSNDGNIVRNTLPPVTPKKAG